MSRKDMILFVPLLSHSKSLSKAPIPAFFLELIASNMEVRDPGSFSTREDKDKATLGRTGPHQGRKLK